MIRFLCQVLVIGTFVRFSDGHGERQVGYQLQPHFNVVIYPANVTAQREGGDVVMDCRDEGPQRAHVVWKSPSGDVLPSSATGRVVLSRVQPEQAGRYECSVPRRFWKASVVDNPSKFLVLVVEPYAAEQCEEGHARCRSGECLPYKNFCDRDGQCADKSDEFNCYRVRPNSWLKRLKSVYYPGDAALGRSCRAGAWTPCNKRCKQYLGVTCSDVSTTYRRFCQRPGAPCGGLRVEPAWSEWSAWTPCSKTCGEAIRQRTRTCNHPAGAARCGHLGMPAEEEKCQNIPCPVDGGWSEWTDWTLCTELGYRSKERLCNSPPPLHGGKECVGVYRESQECHVCSSTTHLKLSPGRVRCTLGRPTTFVCEYCSDDADKNLKIDMDTAPSTSRDTPAYENMHEQEWIDNCLRRAWTLKLNNDHHRVSCTLKDSDDNEIGLVISTIKIRHERLIQTYAACLKDQFTCKDKRCIDNSHFCDGHKDCADGSDEAYCPYENESDYYPDSPETCDATHERFCPSANLCIPDSLAPGGWGADWNTNCGNIVNGKSECRRGQFSCASRQCWTKSCQCDGVNDCGDWSDEVGCPYVGAPHRLPTLTLADVPALNYPNPCYPEQIRCKSTDKCILRTQVCDGELDCDDGSDEEPNCNMRGMSGNAESRVTTRMADEGRPTATECESHEFLCDKKRCLDVGLFWCDGAKDCVDGSDEESCAPKAADANCTEMEFTCTNQQCIRLNYYCDGMRDCMDGTDEVENCENPKVKRQCTSEEFRCSSVAACVATERKCDGKNDCPDASDEDNCPGVDVKTNEIPDQAEYA